MLFFAEPAPPKALSSGNGDSDDGEPGGGDWDDASSLSSARSNKTHLKQLMLTAPVVEAEALAPCKGCGRRASATVPWIQYDPVFDEGPERVLVGKKPKGRVCRLCLTTYKASGWDATYGPIGSYFKFAQTPAGRAKHQEFLHKCKVMATKVDEEGHYLRGSAAKEIGQTQLTLMKSRGSKVMKPSREFVALDAWDEKLDGVLDKTKLTKEDFGEGTVDGGWVVRGRVGVFKEEAYVDQRMEESRLEADDSGPFGKERLANKRSQVAKVFDDTESKRRKLAVERPASGLVGVDDAGALLALLESAAPGLGLGARPVAAAENRNGGSEDEDVDDEPVSQSEDENVSLASASAFFRTAQDAPPISGVAQLAVPRTKKPAQPGAGRSGQATASSGQRARLPKPLARGVQGGPSQGQGSFVKSGAPASGQVANVDGRVARSVNTFKEQIAKEVDKPFSDLIDLSDERLRAAVTKAERKQLSDYVADKLKGGRKVIRAMQSLQNKIGSSKVAEVLQGECADLEQKLAVAKACINLLGLLTKPPPLTQQNVWSIWP